MDQVANHGMIQKYFKLKENGNAAYQIYGIMLRFFWKVYGLKIIKLVIEAYILRN